MEGKINLFLIALLVTNVISMPENTAEATAEVQITQGRIKRSFNNNEHSIPTGYGLLSEERDASVEDNVPCGLLQNSGSREYGYDPHEHQNHGYHKGGSTSVKAAAAASASSYS